MLTALRILLNQSRFRELVWAHSKLHSAGDSVNVHMLPWQWPDQVKPRWAWYRHLDVMSAIWIVTCWISLLPLCLHTVHASCRLSRPQPEMTLWIGLFGVILSGSGCGRCDLCAVHVWWNGVWCKHVAVHIAEMHSKSLICQVSCAPSQNLWGFH